MFHCMFCSHDVVKQNEIETKIKNGDEIEGIITNYNCSYDICGVKYQVVFDYFKNEQYIKYIIPPYDKCLY